MSDTSGMITVDGNEAVASSAYRMNELSIIYPITPSSSMGEHADDWSSKGRKNLWGVVPGVVEMQSEAGAAGAVHGALTSGAITTTYTASQGLLLMIPNMFKIAGELTPLVMHVSARAIATHALSIFGDHSDVMSCRQTGFAMLCSGSPQEGHDFAAIAQGTTFKSRIPFMHFFDGFRTSHEINKIAPLSDDQLRAMIDAEDINAFRARALTPEAPSIRGTAQNPDVFFQAREACNSFYDACPGILQQMMDRFATLTGRAYHLVDYVGHPEAERVMVIMGSGAEIAHETVEFLAAKGEKVGVAKIRLYRPFPAGELLAALPASAKSIAVMDRTKEPGATGEPMYLDVVSAFAERGGTMPTIIGGRYGLSSKEFTPAMVKAVFDEMASATPKRHFTVGINDDVTHLSLPVDASFDIEPDNVVRAVFYGLGSDGTVGANKNSIKIIAEEGDSFGQAYFVYDSKKSGAITTSHLRFSTHPIRSSYLIHSAQFVACHQFPMLEQIDVLGIAAPGATFLLNAPFPTEDVWGHLPREVQDAIIAKKLKVYVIDATNVAQANGMGRRINTIMQTCFFALAGIMPRDVAIEKIKKSIEKTYGRKSHEIVEKNFKAVDDTLIHLHELSIPQEASSTHGRRKPVPDTAPEFIRKVTGEIIAGRGETLPVSAFPVDGTWPSGTSRYEKRNLALSIPLWDPELCIQCGRCAMVCPHGCLRTKVADAETVAKAPEGFRSADFKGKEFGENQKFIVQISPEDCTGCTLCTDACPAKDKTNPSRRAINMEEQLPVLEREKANWAFFESLPSVPRDKVALTPNRIMLLEPLFEFSGACAGCGETSYIKLMTQMFGDRAMVANATGCSSIYGGNLPTTPYCMNAEGHGPAWANSLFEDNAEFGLGMRAACDSNTMFAQALVRTLSEKIGSDLATALVEAVQLDEAGIAAQRQRIKTLKARLAGMGDLPEAKTLLSIADSLVRKSVWIVGGDGWAYDIGYGGLDHVLSSGRDVNILVLDTEVYSNTGGQQSKATPIGASAKFAVAGRQAPKKDLGMEAMSYGNVYVAQIAIGAKGPQTIKAFQEAESFPGPSLIIAYSHCIAHGYDLSKGLTQQQLAVDSGHWPLYRYDPRRFEQGLPPLQLDSSEPKIPLVDYMRNETRFRMVENQNPEHFKVLVESAEKFARLRYSRYKFLAGFTDPASTKTENT
ncbi:MAG TPA: pyruvate:ferredoxin (flavodoxin) oxidoreductase [Rhodospirillaceae bacterium]|nr:MAG: pyruvate:ferredoxin (flavodoxin) oxidoreductase [Alphaproteobacteria bacterium GWF2_58_20]HAU28822.1 pyruvate:ferredoxin (flavodoxin) oxidoreductase [Rhodospirillaceae bacterium]